MPDGEEGDGEGGRIGQVVRRGSVQDGRGRLVFRPGDASLNHLSLALDFSDGIVAEMSAGLRWPVEADEACA